MALKKFAFNVLKKDKFARCGLIETHRGNIKTPAFMPIATQGAVKFTPIEFIEQIGYELTLSNTYHLLLRPGLERLSNIDGVSEFMGWNKPVLTDSGGFQVMSLSKLRKITKKGVIFQSHIDGSSHELTPENVTECVGESYNIKQSNMHQKYETACDPRLNNNQSLDIAFSINQLLKE